MGGSTAFLGPSGLSGEWRPGVGNPSVGANPSTFTGMVTEWNMCLLLQHRNQLIRPSSVGIFLISSSPDYCNRCTLPPRKAGPGFLVHLISSVSRATVGRGGRIEPSGKTKTMCMPPTPRSKSRLASSRGDRGPGEGVPKQERGRIPNTIASLCVCEGGFWWVCGTRMDVSREPPGG